MKGCAANTAVTVVEVDGGLTDSSPVVVEDARGDDGNDEEDEEEYEEVAAVLLTLPRSEITPNRLCSWMSALMRLTYSVLPSRSRK